MPELAITYDDVTVTVRYPSGRDAIFALQHSAEAVLRKLLDDHGQIAALGAVPLELLGEEMNSMKGGDKR